MKPTLAKAARGTKNVGVNSALKEFSICKNDNIL